MKFGAMICAALTLGAYPAFAEVVWTCTQPSAVDGKPTSFRYNIISANEMLDEFGLHWRILRNDHVSLVATFVWPGFDGGPEIRTARTMVIDPLDGRMALSIIDPDAADSGRIIRGVCVKS